MTPTRRRHNRSHEYSRWYRLELNFRRAVRQVPSRELRGLRAWLQGFRRRHGRHRGRTFHELDPVTGQWRIL